MTVLVTVQHRLSSRRELFRMTHNSPKRNHPQNRADAYGVTNWALNLPKDLGGMN